MKKFSELNVGENTGIACLVTAIEETKARNDSIFCKVSLSDGETSVVANYWQRTKKELEQWEKKPVWIEIQVEEYQGAKSYIIKGIHEAPDGVSVQDFILSAPYPSQKMYDNIMQLLKEDGEDSCLTKLTVRIYEERKEELMKASAAKSVHHDCYGGLLYHTLRMLATAKSLCRVYKTLDKELLLTAVALHDIGKLDELETDELGIADYTVDGCLFGHLLIGVEIIDREFYRHEDEYDAERIRLLKHCVASHHGNMEWGAIKVPSIPEAQMLSYIDLIDSRMYIYEKEYQGMESGTMSANIFALGTKIFKP